LTASSRPYAARAGGCSGTRRMAHRRRRMSGRQRRQSDLGRKNSRGVADEFGNSSKLSSANVLGSARLGRRSALQFLDRQVDSGIDALPGAGVERDPVALTSSSAPRVS
jgi:hypothetical protein